VWPTVLLLAVALNLEPTRVGLVPLLLSREQPLRQLAAFLVGSLSVSLGFGFLVLFVLHRSPLGSSSAAGGRAQIVIGAIALVLAAALVVRWRTRRRARTTISPVAANRATTQTIGRVDRFTRAVRAVLHRGRSPWFAGLVGVGVGLPSVDYLAMLVVITTSQTSSAEQSAALVTFVLLGSLVVMVPLIGYLLAPDRTRRIVDRFAEWTRTRSQIEYAGLLALIGAILIGLGYTNL
jgi:hypothetical protein